MTVRERYVPNGVLRFSASPFLLPHWDSSGAPVESCETWGLNLRTSEGGGPREDQTMCSHIARGELLSPYFTPTELIGHVSTGQDRVSARQWVGLPPVKSTRGVEKRMENTSKVISTAWDLFTGDWSFPGLDTRPVDGENTVSHTNQVGSVLSDKVYQFYRPEVDGWYSNGANTAPFKSVTFYRTGDGSLFHRAVEDEFSFSPATSDRSPLRYTHKLIYTDGFEVGTYEPGHNGTKSYDVSWNWSSDDVLQWVDYTVGSYIVSGSTWFHAIWHVTVYFRWDVTIPSTYVLGTEVDIGSFLKLHTHCIIANTYAAKKTPASSWGPLGYNPFLDYDLEFDTDAYALVDPEESYRNDGYEAVLKSGIKNDGTFTSTSTSYNLLRQFDREIVTNGNRLFPSVFYSAKEATEVYVGQLEANHLENLAQLGAMAGLIDPVYGFVNLASHIARKDVVGSVLALFDLLTDAQLLYSYGIAPTINDANELAERGAELNAKYVSKTDLFNIKTVYGKFTFEIPDDVMPNFPGMNLVARSKLRVRFNPNSIFASLLPIKAFGLLPTLSNMWDLIPFSFVADWFTGIGDKLGAADASITMLAFDVIYATNSMKVYWNLPSELLELRNVTDLAGEGEYPLHFSFYIRNVSRVLPQLTYTDIDFQPGSGLPNWKTVSSLAYKLLRR